MPKVLDVQNIEGNIILAKFSGNFDEDTIDENASALTQEIEKTKGASLVFDFSSLEYVNSRGIGEISVWYTRIVENNGRVLYFGANSTIKDILEVVSFTDLFEEVKDLDAAKKSLSAQK
ncbi:MAG: STAS domain-containing protein [Patescibacteria group bacterium]|nr:STAS domain-containing protein [Patescibacteria group bacterium]